MVRLFEAGLCCALACLPLVQSGGKDKGKDKKKEPPKTTQPARPGVRFVPFTGKFSDARKLAHDRNAALLIHIVLEGEADNDKYRTEILGNAELVAACERVVVLVANNGSHPTKNVEEVIEGKKVSRTVCSVYPWFESCGQHSQSFNDLALEYREEDGSLHCPQTILLAPDGSVDLRLNVQTTPEAGEILAGIQEVQSKFGPGLLESEWTEVQHLLDEGRAALDAKTWPVAWRKWSRVREITPKSAYGAEAAKALAQTEKGFADELDLVCAKFVPGTAADAWRQLQEMQRACAGLAFEKEILARLKKAEAKKEIQDELAAVKLEAEADQLLRSAQELSDAKKDKELEKAARKLLGKRYAATPAAAKARELWPQWAREEEAKGVK